MPYGLFRPNFAYIGKDFWKVYRKTDMIVWSKMISKSDKPSGFREDSNVKSKDDRHQVMTKAHMADRPFKYAIFQILDPVLQT